MATAEEYQIILRQSVSGPAAQATAGLAQMQAQAQATRAAMAVTAPAMPVAPPQASDPFAAERAAAANLSAQLDAVRSKAAQIAAAGGKPEAIDAAATAVQGLIVQLDSAKTKLDALKNAGGDPRAIVAAQANVDGLEGKLSSARGALDKMGDGASFESLSMSVKGAAGPMGGLLERAQALKNGLGKAGLAGVALALVAVLAILFAAIVKGAIAIAQFALASADAARTGKLLASGIAGSSAGGEALYNQITQLGAAIPLTRDELNAMAGDLAKSGLKGAALASALEEAAIKAATLKFGPDFANRMLSLDMQATKFKENLAGLFADVKIEGFLKGLKSLGDLISSNTAVGQGLKKLLSSMFTGIFEAASAVFPYVKAFIVGMMVVAVQAYIGFLKLKNAISGAFGGGDKAAGLERALMAGKIVAVALGVALFVVVAAVAVLVGVVLLAGAIMIGPFLLLGYAIYKVYSFLSSLDFGGALAAVGAAISGFVGSAIGALGGLASGAVTAAGNFISGLLSGIANGAGAIISAIVGLASSALGAFTSFFGISSPSLVMSKQGGHIAKGAAEGIDAGADEAQGAMADMMDPRSVKATAKGARGSGGAKIAYFEIHGGGDDVVGKIRELLRAEFEVESMAVEVPT